MIMKLPKHLLNTTEVTTCRNIKSKCSSIFKQISLFFITQDRVNQRKSLFYFKVLVGNNFHQFDETAGKYYGKTCQADTKPDNK